VYHQHLYDSQPAERRKARHRTIAQALSVGRLGATQVELGEIARHVCAGATPGDFVAAAQSSERAARHYARRFAYQAAAEHFRNALSFGKRASLAVEDQVLMALRLCDALWNSSRRAEAEQVADEALDLARSHGDPVLFARAVLAKGYLYVDLVGSVVMPPLIEEALASLPPAELALRAHLLARQAQALQFGGEAEERARLALRIATESGNRSAIAWASYALTMATWGALDHKPAWDTVLRAAARAADEAQETHLGLSVRVFQALDTLERGNVEHAMLLATQLRQDSDALSFPLGTYVMMLREAALAVFRGDLRATDRIGEAAAHGQAVVPEWAQHSQLGQQLVLAWETAQPARLAAALGPLLASQLTEVAVMTFAAFTAAVAGDARAGELYEAACAAEQATVIRNNAALVVAVLLAELDAWHAHPERAQQRYEVIVRFRGYVVVTGGFVTIPALVDFALGKLDHLLGRSAAALDHLTAAMNLAERLESPSWSGRCSAAIRGLSGGAGERLPLR
jgi:tetratricopeptide (TPR) repeat protein